MSTASDDKPRVLLVENDHGNVGGSTRALHRLAAGTIGSHHLFVTFARGSSSPMAATLAQLGCEIVRLGSRPFRTLPTAPSRLPFERFFAAARLIRDLLFEQLPRAIELARIIRRHRIDLVHANNNLVANRYAIWAAAWCGVPIVCHQRFFIRCRIFERWSARFVRTVLCISRAVRDDLLAQIEPADVRIVYDGVDVPADFPGSPELAPDAKITMIGRVVPWKGQDILLRAVPIVIRDHPRVRFLIVGAPVDPGDHAYQSKLDQLIAELRIDSYVEFVGYVDDIDDRLRTEFDVVVHASITPEPFGLVVAEGMAAGRPVIASGEGGCAEIIEDGVSGLLFRPRDSEDLAEKLISILDNPDLGRRLGYEGWRRAGERFNAHRNADEVANAWDDALATHRSDRGVR